jgi:sigma-E factor negative regulatory protein RseC
MIEQNAVVIRTDGQYAEVEAQRKSACGSCNAKTGCGTGMLESVTGGRAMRMQALNQCDAHVGDEVVVAVPEKGFVKGAFFTYFLPLLMMLVGAVLAQQLDLSGMGLNQDVSSLAGAVVGFVIALLWLRRYSRKLEKDPGQYPVVIRKINPFVTLNIKQFRKEQLPF